MSDLARLWLHMRVLLINTYSGVNSSAIQSVAFLRDPTDPTDFGFIGHPTIDTVLILILITRLGHPTKSYIILRSCEVQPTDKACLTHSRRTKSAGL